MNMAKKLAMTSLVAMSMGFGGCTVMAVGGTIEDLKDPPMKTVQEKDNVAGFVINDDGTLIMLSGRYVYVFDDNDKVARLKKMLTTPEFLKLSYHWEIGGGTNYRHHISHGHDGRFNFGAYFWYQYHNAQELQGFQKVGIASDHDDLAGVNRQHYLFLGDFSGKVYQHNASSKALLAKVKPLSRPYDFIIDRQKPNKAKSIAQALFLPLALPFTIVGDLLILPVSLPVTLNGGKIDIH